MYEVVWHVVTAVVALAPLIAALLALKWLADLKAQSEKQTRLAEEQNELLRALLAARSSTTGSEDERHQKH